MFNTEVPRSVTRLRFKPSLFWLQKVLLIVVTLLCFTLTANADDNQKKLEDLKKTIAELQRSLSAQNKEKTELEISLKAVEVEASNLSANIRSLHVKITREEAELKDKAAEKHELEQSINQQSDAIIEQLRSAHKLGDQEPVKLLLNQEDPKKIARMFKYYDYLLSARAEKIDEYSANVDKLSKIIQSINKNKLELIASNKALTLKNKALKLRITDREKTLKKLQLSLADDAKRLNRLQTQRSDLEDILNAVEEAVADLVLPTNSQPFASRRGKLSWPATGKLLKRYGSRRSGPMRWKGWLIDVKAGAPVKAIHQGRVVFSNYLRGFGLLLILDHGDGYMTLYGHNQELLKDTGDWVQSNEQIARVGNTGGLTRSALYFEVRSQGKPANPKLWLSQK